MKFGNPAVTFVYHLGVHCTDDNLLVRSLLQNGDDLKDGKIIVPRPKRYRGRLADITAKYKGEPLPDDVQQALYDDILLGNPAERVILSQESFLTGAPRAFEGGVLYSKAETHSIWLRYLFPENPCEFFIAIRDPATFVPEILRMDNMPGYEEVMGETDPLSLRWSRVIADIQEGNPGCPVTVWCNEDTPLIWPTVLREVAGIDDSEKLDGEYNLLKSIMKADGYSKMLTYLESHPPKTEEQRRRVFGAFLDKFALDDVLEEDIDLPGWTPELVDEMTALYEQDVAQIAAMPGVKFIAP